MCTNLDMYIISLPPLLQDMCSSSSSKFAIYFHCVVVVVVAAAVVVVVVVIAIAPYYPDPCTETIYPLYIYIHIYISISPNTCSLLPRCDGYGAASWIPHQMMRIGTATTSNYHQARARGADWYIYARASL